MALINCPECKREVSSLAKNCPQCGFSFEIKTVLRLELHLSNEDNIFELYIDGFCGDELIVEARKSLALMHGLSTMEVTFYGDIDCIQFTFTEHLKSKTYNLNLDPNSTKRNIGIRLTEVRNPYDEPTYAGNYIYFHPDVEGEIIEFNSITSKYFPEIKYK